MSDARLKLNVAYANGMLFVSALIGVMAQSWLIFGIVLLFMLAGGAYCGEIRPRAGKR